MMFRVFGVSRMSKRDVLVSDPGVHHGMCVTHMTWCMSGLVNRGGGENVPCIPGACAPAILHIWQEAHGWFNLYPSDWCHQHQGDQTVITLLVMQPWRKWVNMYKISQLGQYKLMHIETKNYTDGLVQDCSISIANALEVLQPYTKPSICTTKWPS